MDVGASQDDGGGQPGDRDLLAGPVIDQPAVAEPLVQRHGRGVCAVVGGVVSHIEADPDLRVGLFDVVRDVSVARGELDDDLCAVSLDGRPLRASDAAC